MKAVSAESRLVYVNAGSLEKGVTRNRENLLRVGHIAARRKPFIVDNSDNSTLTGRICGGRY